MNTHNIENTVSLAPSDASARALWLSAIVESESCFEWILHCHAWSLEDVKSCRESENEEENTADDAYDTL